MKTSKKVISLLLSVIMVMTCFAVAVPQLTIEAEAQFETINGISQSYIVPEDTRDAIYDSYAAAYLNGYGEPTDLLIPGLSETNNYVVQGMAYYPEKNWALITAYHNNENSPSPSMVYCIDIKTGDFVAMFSFLNVPDADGNVTPNTDHGGGIAISEHNIYYSCGDKDRKIAYAPLSAIEGIENDESKYRTVQLVAEQTFYEIGSVADGNKTAYSAYCCYDQGVLWTGNFYNDGVLLGLIAADYNVKAHSGYPSMVWGYRLSGSTPEEEWANLTSNTQNCQGNPTYVIGLPENIIDVQYATVDDGRLYLSRSYGTGTETSINAGMSAYSQLSIADIDLTVPGTGKLKFTIDANGTEREINNAYILPESQIKTFNFMPMSEGLCVIDDYVYMTFESACYKYYKDAGLMGNCDMPIDVVWRIDQYGLLGHERPDEKAVTAYQKVMDLSEIKATDEYMVVYESEMRAEGNQNNILYALDSYGGYKGDRLPKTDAGTKANTLDSMGMIGHEITDYHKYTNANGQEFLVLGNPTKDDVPNIRWNLIGAGTDATRIHSVSLYNASYSYLYFDSRLIYMSTLENGNLDQIKFLNKEVNGVKYPGEFFLFHEDNSSYLWCNDGSVEAIMQAYDDYYHKDDFSSYKYYKEDEIPGTFHADALKSQDADNSGNQAYALPAPYELGSFNIYKRITIDPETMGGTGLETDLKAELQYDGTYTINMGTYATSEAHKYLGESGYPTDFMFVLDASGSMTNNNDYVTYQSQGNKDISRGMANDGTGYYVYVDEVLKPDGTVETINQFCLLDGHYSGIPYINAKYWVTANAQDGSGYKFFVDTDGKFKWSESQITKVGGADTTITNTLPVYRKVTTSRLQGMKDTVNSFISKIDANAQTYNIEHRVGIATFGSDGYDENSTAYRNTGIYSTLGGTALNQYGYKDEAGNVYTNDNTDHYAAAFYPSNHSNLHTIVNAIDTTTEDPDTFANFGMDMAVNAFAQQSPAFGGAGDRYYADFTDEEGILHEKNANAVLIFLTDGCPGKGGSQVGSATEVANFAIPSSNAIKANGGVVYSVQVSNATMDGFDMAAYMNGVSSNYPSASSLTSLGSQSSSDYYVKAATDGSVDVNMVLNGVFEHIENNYIDVGTAITLDEDSIVRQKLGSNFKLTSESSVSLTTSTVKEDVLGNVIFDGNTTVTDLNYTKDVTNNTIQVTGFDYSSNYYAKNAKQGKRLNIIIDKVLPIDTDEDTMNISNATYTAIYENAANMNDTTAGAGGKKFKGYPNAAFEIPEYTYVLDYGMQMLDTDINGTLKSVSDTLSKQADSAGKPQYNTSDAQGAVKIATNSLDLIYNITPTQTTVDKNYVLIQRNDGTYDWFQINVVPASNVLYEEETMVDGTTGLAWSTEYSLSENKPLNISQSIAGAGDTYGHDVIYETTTNDHSNGTAYKATVDATNKRSAGKTVTFNGTGFDLISACGANTGIMSVTVKDSTGKLVKGYVVDTYYRDTNNMNAKGLACQVPVVNFTGDYGTYTVETTALYLSKASALKKTVTGTVSSGKLKATTAVPTTESYIKNLLVDLGMADLANADLELVWFDDNSVLNGGTGAKGKVKTTRAGETITSLDCYIDGFRVYNPLDTGSSSYIATEQMPQYINVLKSLTGRDDSVSAGATVGDIAYVETALTDGTLSFANYNQVGPQNETYLKGGSTGNALILKVQLSNTSEVHLGLRAVNGTATVKIGGTDFVIKGPTEMYYDVTDCLEVDQNTGMATITIQNAGTGLLAVNNIKMTQQSAIVILEESDLAKASMLMAASPVRADVINGVVTPIIEDDTNVDNGDDNTAGDNTDSDTNEPENGGSTGSGSFIEQLINMIIEMIKSLFSFLPAGEVM